MKNLVYIFGVIALGLVAVVAYFLFGTSAYTQLDYQEPDQRAVGVPEGTVASTSSGMASLRQLVEKNDNLECEITYVDTSAGASTVTGTYFTANGKLRGDFIVPDMASGSVSSIILRDNTLYTWSVIEGQTYGVKVNLATLAEKQAAGTALETQEPVPLDNPVSYTCNPWPTVDTSIFEPPTTVLFRDMADITAGGMEYGTSYGETNSTKTQCDLCAQINPGEGQNECRKTFACQ